MLAVINIGKLFLFVGGGLTYFFGLGWVVTGLLTNQGLTARNDKTPFMQQISLALLCGLIINYAIVLCFLSLRTSFIIGSIFSAIGLLCFIVFVVRRRLIKEVNFSFVLKVAALVLLCLSFLNVILSEPLFSWDARSIWFLHAKMIFSAGTLGAGAGWQHSSIVWSHPDYPKLIPLIAAQTSYIIGFWNEYLPKLSLFFMLVPPLVWVFTFSRRSFSFMFLLVVLPAVFYVRVWDGYMDGYHALYFSIAMLLLGRYLQKNRTIDLISSFTCAIALLYIKNEGTLAALISIFLILLLPIFQKRKFAKSDFLLPWKYYLALFLGVVPLVLWIFYKGQWHLSNDLAFGFSSLQRIGDRIADGSYKLIVAQAYLQIQGVLLIVGMLSLLLISRKQWLPKESCPAFLAGVLFLFGLMVVYLAAPHDLLWHLSTSIDRTMLSVTGCFVVGCYFILDSIE